MLPLVPINAAAIDTLPLASDGSNATSLVVGAASTTADVLPLFLIDALAVDALPLASHGSDDTADLLPLVPVYTPVVDVMPLAFPSPTVDLLGVGPLSAGGEGGLWRASAGTGCG